MLRDSASERNLLHRDRQLVELPDEDREYLDTLGKEWRAEQHPSVDMVIISNYDLPEGYDHQFVDLMIIIPSGYPTAGLDMFYLDPEIQRKDGRAIDMLTTECKGGRQWQQWSRHYDWQLGSGFAEHLDVVRQCLVEEVS